MPKNTKEVQLSVKAKEEMAVGVYANLAKVTSGEHDSMLDFVMIDHSSATPESANGYLVARVVVANSHLPAVADMLNKHLAQMLKDK
ncbi:MAG: DUF3467 domain-containing protein [Actinomycetota bacterium]|nr:DUF3467 domain-containing protein [Actinomycetota bacterium]